LRSALRAAPLGAAPAAAAPAPRSSVTPPLTRPPPFPPQDDQGADCHDVEHEHWINGFPTPIANPMSMYKQYQGTRKTWGINALGSLIVEVEAEDGTVGVGITIGGEPGCFIVENHLSRFCEGQDPRDVRATLCRFCRAAASLADPDGIAARSS